MSIVIVDKRGFSIQRAVKPVVSIQQRLINEQTSTTIRGILKDDCLRALICGCNKAIPSIVEANMLNLTNQLPTLLATPSYFHVESKRLLSKEFYLQVISTSGGKLMHECVTLFGIAASQPPSLVGASMNL